MKQPSKIDILVGQRIRDIRSAAGLSEPQLAERIGLQVASLEAIEAGTQRAGTDILTSVATELGVPVTTFFDVRVPDRGQRHKNSATAKK